MGERGGLRGKRGERRMLDTHTRCHSRGFYPGCNVPLLKAGQGGQRRDCIGRCLRLVVCDYLFGLTWRAL